MAWRNCRASTTLADEINKRWPNRDRASDGTIGDAAHATRSSDHNPFIVVAGQGVVRARDVDKDGVDAPWLVEHLRSLGARRDPRLNPGGYLIFNRRITTPDFTGWRVYNGTNPHEHHFHVSFSTVAAGFDSTAPWGIWPVGTPSPTPRPAAPTPGGDWFAMASEADLRRIMREEILQALVPDYFTADDKDRMWLSECLAWGTTHAAHARDAARAGLAKATTLESKVDALLARVVSGTTTGSGPTALSDADVDRIVTALVKRSRAPLA